MIKRKDRRIAKFHFKEIDMVNYPSCRVYFEKGFAFVSDIVGNTWKFNSGQFDVTVQMRKHNVFVEVFSKFESRNNINRLSDFIINRNNNEI